MKQYLIQYAQDRIENADNTLQYRNQFATGEPLNLKPHLRTHRLMVNPKPSPNLY
jgi:hypothetical protein